MEAILNLQSQPGFIDLKDKLDNVDFDRIESKYIKINNRRYLGNKFKLTSFIKTIVAKECKGVMSVADIFSGTGAVAAAFADKKLITNDILYSNYLCHCAWFGNGQIDMDKLKSYIIILNNLDFGKDNYMSENFSDTYFSKENCRKIGTIRETIESEYNKNKINFRERAFLITSLLYAMDKIASTCGHYDAYRQGEDLNKTLELFMLEITPKNPDNEQYNIDTNLLVKDIEADLVYIDPPYNSRQYCDAYHLLENVARWEKPKVSGVAKKMDRAHLKSRYCSKDAILAFEDLINNIKAKYILLSYNNMSGKGNDRSNAKMADKDIIRILEKKGRVKIFEENYKAFTTGKSDIEDNKERLFLCICGGRNKKLIPSPLNYCGGKYKLLPQILPLFPDKINHFVDLFAGGCNVGLNVNSRSVTFCDRDSNIINLYQTLKAHDKPVVFEAVFDIIEKYNLSKSYKNGYAFYNVNSADGFARINKANYLKLRTAYNSYKETDYQKYLLLYVLIVYGFNNQLRFNKKGEFNLPVGKRDFNSKMQKKLSGFIDCIQSRSFKFVTSDFRSFDLTGLNNRDFVYVDPPYLITCASYNESNGWSETDEKDLLKLLDALNSRGIRFALSNVLESKGKENTLLKDWLEARSYNIHYLNYNYSNSNYQTKNRDAASTEEVLITNY